MDRERGMNLGKGVSQGRDFTKDLAAFLAAYLKEIEDSACDLLVQEMPELTEELFGLYERTGNRLEYEAVYFARRKFLAVLGMWALVDVQGGFVQTEERLTGAEPLQETKEGAGRQGGTSANRDLIYAKLSEVIREICEEECWALPAHVNRAENPDWRLTVDLFAAETAQTLSELVDRIGVFLTPEVCSLAIDQIERRVFQPFFTSKVPYSGWERAGHNWNAVCSGAIGSACLHLLRGESERLEKCIERICKALPYYLAGFSEDGACAEGIGYYFYGMTYFVNFAQELYEYSKGEKDLFCGAWGGLEAMGEVAGEGIKCGGKLGEWGKPEEPGKPEETEEPEEPGKPDRPDKRLMIAWFPAKCFFPDGMSVSFSDGSFEETFRVGVLSVLALHYAGISDGKKSWGAKTKSADMKSVERKIVNEKSGICFDRFFPSMERAAGLHTDSCYRFAALKMDWVYTKRLLEAFKGKAALKPQENGFVHVFPQTQWFIASSQTGVGFACKGGYNEEPHNHNDIGHFLYEADRTMFFTDLGAGEYTKDYFSGERYGILCNSALGHSVPIIDGQIQRAGRQYVCDVFQVKRDGVVRMELKTAYPKGLLDGFSREFRFERESGRLSVRDCVVFSGERERETRGTAAKGREVSGVEAPGMKVFGTKIHGMRAHEIETRSTEAMGGRVVENLVTQLPPQVDGNHVCLKGERGSCILEVDQADVRFRIKEYEHRNHQGMAEKVYAIQWEIPENAGKWECAFSIWGCH